MPRLSKPQLIGEFIRAVQSSGGTVLLLNGVNDHPARLSVSRGNESLRVILYIWNITHGGATRDPDELRIQVTNVTRFAEEADAKTLVMGWSEDEEAFAGIDVTRHRVDMTGRSPSLQIHRGTMQDAIRLGMKAQVRGNDEITIAVRPDMMFTYIQELEALHRSADRAEDFQTLNRIVQTPTEARIVDVPAGPRRTELVTVQRKIRDARFRANVMAAYQHRCAASGIQLDLLDAAHIVPVEHAQGTDELLNGLCLSAIHHRAFDRGLLGIKTDYAIVINERKVGELRQIGWDGGLDVFRRTLRDQINLPARREHYPSPQKLLLGQTLRGWSASRLS